MTPQSDIQANEAPVSATVWRFQHGM